jgi:hypothetical protein
MYLLYTHKNKLIMGTKTGSGDSAKRKIKTAYKGFLNKEQLKTKVIKNKINEEQKRQRIPRWQLEGGSRKCAS